MVVLDAYSHQLSESDHFNILNFMLDSAKLSLSDVENAMDKIRMKEVIENHPYAISQGKDGRWRTYVGKGKDRKMIAKKDLDGVHKAIYENYKHEHGYFETIGDLFPELISQKELHGAAPTYIKKLKSHWKKYYSDSEIVKTPIRSLTKLVCDRWAHETIQKNNLTKKEYNNVAAIIRQTLDYAIDLGIISVNVYREVKIQHKVFRKTKKKSSHSQVFTKQELRKLTELAWDEIRNGNPRRKHKLLPLAMLFQVQTGVRASELVALEHDEVDYDRKELTIERMYRFETKRIDEYTKGSYGDRVVILTDTALEILREVDRIKSELGVNTKYIFSIFDSPIPYRSLYRLYSSYCEKAGIMHKATHTARRTFVSMLLSADVSLNSVRESCGHMDSRTTLNNYGYDVDVDEEKRNKFEKALTW